MGGGGRGRWSEAAGKPERHSPAGTLAKTDWGLRWGPVFMRKEATDVGL